jgi:O-antigen ligase
VNNVLPTARAIALLIFIVALFFLRDAAVPASTVFTAGVVLLAALCWPFATRPDARPLALLPYVAYLAILTLSWRWHGDGPSTDEYLRQLAFLATIWSVAFVAARTGAAAWVAAIVICLSLVIVQILGPRSMADHFGRDVIYSAIDQWSGYPEIGLLAGLGAGAAAALAWGGSGLSLRLAGAALATGFVVAPIFLYSRFAIVTAIAVVVWVGFVCLARWRWTVGAVLIAGLAASSAWIAVGPGDTPARARAALVARVGSHEAGIRAEGWRVAEEMMRAAPWLGVGPGRYRVDYGRYSTRSDSFHAYNIVLHTGAEIGLVGLAVYLWLWGRALWISLAAASDRSREGAAALAVHGMLVAFFLRSQSEHFLANLTTSFRLLLLVGVLIGLAEGARTWRRGSHANAEAGAGATKRAVIADDEVSASAGDLAKREAETTDR